VIDPVCKQDRHHLCGHVDTQHSRLWHRDFHTSTAPDGCRKVSSRATAFVGAAIAVTAAVRITCLLCFPLLQLVRLGQAAAAVGVHGAHLHGHTPIALCRRSNGTVCARRVEGVAIRSDVVSKHVQGERGEQGHPSNDGPHSPALTRTLLQAAPCQRGTLCGHPCRQHGQPHTHTYTHSTAHNQPLDKTRP